VYAERGNKTKLKAGRFFDWGEERKKIAGGRRPRYGNSITAKARGHPILALRGKEEEIWSNRKQLRECAQLRLEP